jgi:hypothetical protein
MDAINLRVKRSPSLWCRARQRAVFLKLAAIVDGNIGSDSFHYGFPRVLSGNPATTDRNCRHPLAVESGTEMTFEGLTLCDAHTDFLSEAFPIKPGDYS